jgi:hypothetical protein
MASLRLSCLVFLLATFTPAPLVFELCNTDPSCWDCLTKPGGAAKTQEAEERNRQKNRSVIDLTSRTIKSFDVGSFLPRRPITTGKLERSIGAF